MAVDDGADGFFVDTYHRVDVFRATGATLDLEHSHARLHHAVDEAHGLQVLGTHKVFVVYLYLVARLGIGEQIGAAAYLYALAAVGRAVGIGKAHVALAADGHTQRAVAEHLYAHGLAAGSADGLLGYLAVDVGHLVEVELACEHHHIGEMGVETQGFDVGDVELRGQVNLHSNLAAVGHNGHVAGYHRRDMGFEGGIDDGSHHADVVVVDDGVDGEIGLDAVGVARGGYEVEVVDGEVVG